MATVSLTKTLSSSSHDSKSSKQEVTYDSDEEPPEDPQEQLQWRGDPAETHSDWTIEVVSFKDDKETIETYHVHKFALAFGARRSEYLENLINTKDQGLDANNMVELHSMGAKVHPNSTSTRLELDALAAKVFPQLLDYIYKPDKLVIETNTATALHYLGQLLGIRRLRWQAKQFWKKDLGTQNVGTYYEHAHIFEDDQILEMVKDLLVKEIMNIKVTSKITRVSHCELWLSVLELLHAQNAKDHDKKIKHISELIAEFASKNVKRIDVKSFDKLTAPDKLPVISYKAAVALLETKSELGGKSSTDLQDRCTTAMASEWESVHTKLTQADWQRHEQSKQTFQTELYKKTLKQCYQDKKKAAKELERVQKELRATKIQLDKTRGELKLYKPVTEKSSIQQRGRSLFRKTSESKPHCTYDGQQVFFRASVC